MQNEPSPILSSSSNLPKTIVPPVAKIKLGNASAAAAAAAAVATAAAAAAAFSARRQQRRKNKNQQFYKNTKHKNITKNLKTFDEIVEKRRFWKSYAKTDVTIKFYAKN